MRISHGTGFKTHEDSFPKHLKPMMMLFLVVELVVNVLWYWDKWSCSCSNERCSTHSRLLSLSFDKRLGIFSANTWQKAMKPTYLRW